MNGMTVVVVGAVVVVIAALVLRAMFRRACEHAFPHEPTRDYQSLDRFAPAGSFEATNEAEEATEAPLRERIAGMMEKPKAGIQVRMAHAMDARATAIADAIAGTSEWLRTPERDDCQLVSREELEQVRREIGWQA